MLKNTCVEIFLQDVKKNSEVIILEQASKERKELIEIARKRGIIITKDDKDLGVVKGIYCFTDLKNENNQQVPTDEIIKALPGIVGKAMDVDHLREQIVGFFIGYDFIMKEKKAIAYAVFFKSNFPKLWEKINKLHGKKKLSFSFELWADKNKRKILDNGVEELHSISVAGGALVLEEGDTRPAFPEAKILNLAMEDYKKTIDNKYLVYASQHKDDEIITCKNGICTTNKINKAETIAPEKTSEETKPITENIPTIKCQNCEENIVVSFPQNEIKCPKCKAILDMNGKMLFPPQNIDFNIICPACKINNWRILSSTDNKTKVRCSCEKEYELTFKTVTEKETNDKDFFNESMLFDCKISCIQCGKKIDRLLNSTVKSKSITCPDCGITFIINSKDSKKIKRIESIVEIEKSSVKGGKDNMKISKEIAEKVKAEEIAKAEKEKATKEVVKKDKKVKEPEAKKDEAKAEVVKSEEAPKPEEKKEDTAPKVEIVDDKKVRVTIPKVEKPKEEAKKEEKKPEVKVEPKADEKKEEAKSQEKAEAVFAKDSSKVKDEKEHLSIKDVEKAKSVLARVEQFDKVPEWYSGTLEELKTEVKTTIEKQYPDINDAKKEKPKKVECSCVECGYKQTSEEHCVNLKCPKCGGQMRRATRPGDGKPEKKVKSTKTLRKAVKKRKDVELAKDELEKITVEKSTKLEEGIRKLAKQLIEAKAEIKNIEKASEEKISFYKENAKSLYDRKEELEEYAEGLSDKKIMNDKDFEIAKLTKERDELAGKKIETASEIVGDKANKDIYKANADAVDKIAFGKK